MALRESNQCLEMKVKELACRDDQVVKIAYRDFEEFKSVERKFVMALKIRNFIKNLTNVVNVKRRPSFCKLVKICK